MRCLTELDIIFIVANFISVIIIIHLFTASRSRNPKIKNIYIVVAIPITDNDAMLTDNNGMLITFNGSEKSINKNKIQWTDE